MLYKTRCAGSGARRARGQAAVARGLSPLANIATLAALAVLILSDTAQADPFHAQTLPLGQRAIGLGGAFVAVADDPSASYHNPAGIVWTSGTALSAGLTLTAFDRSKVEGGYRTSAGSRSLKQSSGASLPVFVAAAKHLGRRDALGRRRHAIAISSFTTSQRRLGFDVEVGSPSAPGGTLETLSIDQSERSAWYGLSYAYLVRSKLSLGVSGFLSVHRTHYAEERISVALGERLGAGNFASPSNSWTSHLVDRNVKTMIARFGALYEYSEHWRFGVMFQPPSIHVRGSAYVRERRLHTDLTAPEPSSSFFQATHDVGAANPAPWELRVGARYAFHKRLVLSFDTSLYGRTGSSRDPVLAVGPRRPHPVTGAVAELGAFTEESWYRTYNGNVAVGLSTLVRERFVVRCGLYTDLSSAPPVPRFTSTYQAADVHRAGGALSLGILADGYDISLGMVGVVGRGDALSFNNDLATDETYQRTHATDQMFFLFLNGVKGAVKTLAQKANEKLEELMKPDPEEVESSRPEPQR